MREKVNNSKGLEATHPPRSLNGERRKHFLLLQSQMTDAIRKSPFGDHAHDHTNNRLGLGENLEITEYLVSKCIPTRYVLVTKGTRWRSKGEKTGNFLEVGGEGGGAHPDRRIPGHVPYRRRNK